MLGFDSEGQCEEPMSTSLNEATAKAYEQLNDVLDQSPAIEASMSMASGRISSSASSISISSNNSLVGSLQVVLSSSREKDA